MEISASVAILPGELSQELPPWYLSGESREDASDPCLTRSSAQHNPEAFTGTAAGEGKKHPLSGSETGWGEKVGKLRLEL